MHFFINNFKIDNNLQKKELILKKKFNSDFLFNKFIFYKINIYLISILKNNSNNNLFKYKNTNTLVNLFFQNFFYINNFTNFFYNYSLNKNNFIILNNDYFLIYPLYKFLFGEKFINIYKEFLFVKPVNFTFKNWVYFLKKFFKAHKINLIFLFDYNHYINFYKNIKELDVCVAAIINYNNSSELVDYSFYSYSCDLYTKITYYTYLYSIYNVFLNYKIFYYQYKYINIFYNFSKF